ncbi:MAG: hypothetical protein R2873_31455 [Caldilineaceae bacterium]
MPPAWAFFAALGIYLTFRILDFPDLTVDGSFPLGVKAVTATLITSGMNVTWCCPSALRRWRSCRHGVDRHTRCCASTACSPPSW